MSRKLVVKRELNKLHDLERNLKENSPKSDERCFTRRRAGSPSPLARASFPPLKTSSNTSEDALQRGRSSTSPPALMKDPNSTGEPSTLSNIYSSSTTTVKANAVPTSQTVSSHVSRTSSNTRRSSLNIPSTVRHPSPLARDPPHGVNTTVSSPKVRLSPSTKQVQGKSSKSPSLLERVLNSETNSHLNKSLSSATKNLSSFTNTVSPQNNLSSTSKNLELDPESGSSFCQLEEKVSEVQATQWTSCHLIIQLVCRDLSNSKVRMKLEET